MLFRSRRCTLAEFWVTAPLFRWLQAVGEGAIDWRVWAYCLVLRHLAASNLERVLVLTGNVLPPMSEHVPHLQVRQVAVGPHDNFAATVASLEAGGGEFDAVCNLVLLDPGHDGFCAIVNALGRLCRPGATVCLVLAGGVAERNLAAVSRRLAEAGLIATPCWTTLLSGRAEPAFADPRVEPYLCAEIDGVTRPIIAVELTRAGSSAASRPALAEESA